MTERHVQSKSVKPQKKVLKSYVRFTKQRQTKGIVRLLEVSVWLSVHLSALDYGSSHSSICSIVHTAHSLAASQPSMQRPQVHCAGWQPSYLLIFGLTFGEMQTIGFVVFQFYLVDQD